MDQTLASNIAAFEQRIKLAPTAYERYYETYKLHERYSWLCQQTNPAKYALTMWKAACDRHPLTGIQL